MGSVNKDKNFDKEFKKEYLYPKFWLSWIGIIILGVLSFIPACIRDFFATILSFLLTLIPCSFKDTVYTNFLYAFPNNTKQQNDKLYRDFLRVGLKVVLGYGECFFRSKKFIINSFEVEGKEYFDEAVKTGKPIIFMAPHAWAIDHCGLYLSANGLKMCTMMHTSKNELYDWFMNSMRLKFGGKVYERSAGIKTIIKALRDGYSSFFLPDEDLGSESAIFIPFFATLKATLITMPKLAQLGKAIVVPMYSCYNEKTRKYRVVFDKYFENYPTENLEEDVIRINKATENLILGREKQYMWFLRYYKTRPENEDPYHGYP